jgi:alpha-beta hydrolase superfamily lysophospholipase
MTRRDDGRTGTSFMVRCLCTSILAAAVLGGCAAPRLQDRAAASAPARLEVRAAIMTDGYRLPLQRWGDPARSQALLLALHGFNDYRNAFADLGAFLAGHGILTYAYDQRGFGATAQRGRWAGEEQMIADLGTLTGLLRVRHPDLPLFLLGESMGGALVMAARLNGSGADGAILVAPAVWSRDTMNPLQSLTLQLAAHTVPWLELSGRGLDIRPSDNLDMLRGMSEDPLVIKGTRVDALWGVTNVMDLGMAASGGLQPPVLLLYGERDEIIPKNAFCAMLERLPEDTTDLRIVLYRDGWHMLTRDLQAGRVKQDIAAWLADRDAILPSGEEIQRASPRLARLCRG